MSEAGYTVIGDAYEIVYEKDSPIGRLQKAPCRFPTLADFRSGRGWLEVYFSKPEGGTSYLALGFGERVGKGLLPLIGDGQTRFPDADGNVLLSLIVLLPDGRPAQVETLGNPDEVKTLRQAFRRGWYNAKRRQKAAARKGITTV